MKTLTSSTSETTCTGKIDWTELNKNIADNIDIVLNYFNIEYSKYQNRAAFACPVHDSSNTESANVFISGNEKYGNFVCWSNHCEENIGRGAVNLVQFLLSKKLDKQLGLNDVLRELKPILNIDEYKRLSVDDTSSFSKFVLNHNEVENKVICTKKYLIDTLEIPSKYFLQRGFSPEVLLKYNVGYCKSRGKKMYMRSVAPVLSDDNPELVIGCVGRTHYDKCLICEKYHSPNKACPSNRLEEKWASKWINSDKFNTGKSLYGLWLAKESILDSSAVVLVEGQGDVWRLSEAGIQNVLGMYGSNFTDHHRVILDSLGVSNVIVASDNDEAGNKCYSNIVEKYSKFYNIRKIDFPYKDIGEIPVEEIKKIFRGVF